MKQICPPALLAAALLLCANTRAAVSPISPFTGNLSEGWESFRTYMGGYYLPDPTRIMGGGASISSSLMSVYLTNSDTSFGLGSSGNVKVADGTKGMGLDGFAQTATITFANPVVDFGAYWGAATPPWGPESPPVDPAPTTVSLAFSDGSFDSFTYFAPDHSGTLEWHGWHFTTGITGISYTGDFVAVDGLQASVIPEPATALLGGVGAGLLALRRYRYAEQARCTERRDDASVACLGPVARGR
jgi:hypothetical protein